MQINIIDIDKWQEIIQTLKKQKLRTGLTAFGVFWGIFMLVILLGFGTGFGIKVDAQFGDAKNIAIFRPSSATQIAYQGLGKGRKIALNEDDIEAIKQKIPGLQMVDGKNNLGSTWGSPQYIVHDKNSGSFSVSGSHAGWEPFEFIRVIEGRYINKNDEDNIRKVAVIGTRVKDILFKNEGSPIGKSVNIQGVLFEVIGVYKTTQEDNPRQNVSIYIPNQSLRKAFNQLDSFKFIFFQPKDGVSSKEVSEKVKKLLYERKKIHPDDAGVLVGFNMEEEYQQSKKLVQGIIGFSWLVAIGTIVAGVIGVGNIMLVVVKERTREIGLRKALGATPLKIRLMIIQEALFITILAGYTGLVAGVVLLEAIKNLLIKIGQGEGMFSSPYIDIKTALLALSVLTIAGVIASLLPAIKASSINPISALQDE